MSCLDVKLNKILQDAQDADNIATIVLRDTVKQMLTSSCDKEIENMRSAGDIAVDSLFLVLGKMSSRFSKSADYINTKNCNIQHKAVSLQNKLEQASGEVSKMNACELFRVIDMYKINSIEKTLDFVLQKKKRPGSRIVKVINLPVTIITK